MKITEIQKVAVIGSGVMGAAIAAHMANSGMPVLLLDIVPQAAKNRNELAEKAIERLLATEPAPLTHKRKAKLITPGNIDDNLKDLGEVDWIIEVVVEKLEVKQGLYHKIDAVRKPGSIVSSNTSTLPLYELVDGMPKSFAKDFLITHFFNPPRYMRLLELIVGDDTRKDAVQLIEKFVDCRLGKQVVHCKDTPGFIANRIGCFWMEVGLLTAIDQGVTVEEADSVMGKPIGVPKTAIFGLMDLIGIDLMPLIAKSMLASLPIHDEFRNIHREPEVVTKMIDTGYTGRKGKGGFYRLNKENGQKLKEAIDLQKGKYHPQETPKLESVEAAKSGLKALVTHPDKGGKYAWSVLSQTFAYTASLIPEISDDIISVDEAMRNGYNWKYGIFELIDRLGDDEQTGAAWFAEALTKEGRTVPPILEKAAAAKGFYTKENGQRFYLTQQGSYAPIPVDPEAWTLADIKLKSTPITKNGSATLWDVGDGIVCMEFTTKMNSVDPGLLEMMNQAIEIVKKDYKGLIIGGDAENFCVGANLGFLLFSANVASWKMIEDVIKQGQDTYMALKYAPFPVVSAPAGMALGGGCELLLHSDAVQAHCETYAGLVEVGVGVIPGWGGCTEMLLRSYAARQKEASVTAKLGRMFSAISPVRIANAMPAIAKVFETISMAKVSKSAEEAKDMMILNDKSHITMNRKRLLADAKQRCLELADGYQPPEPQTITLPGKTAKAALSMAVDSFVRNGKATAYDEVVSKKLAYVLSGGDTDIGKPLTEQQVLDLERSAFMELIREPRTLARIEHMLETGKPLRN